VPRILHYCQRIEFILSLKMPHHTMSSWAATMTRHKDMYESVRAAALGLTTSGRNTPTSQQGQGAYHSLNESSDVEMFEAGRDAEELEELQVGASLVVGEDESTHDDELQPSLEGANEDESERDAYARDFEAIVEFFMSPDADTGQEHEIFERLTAKVIPVRTLIDGPPNNLATERMHHCSELVCISGQAR